MNPTRPPATERLRHDGNQPSVPQQRISIEWLADDSYLDRKRNMLACYDSSADTHFITNRRVETAGDEAVGRLDENHQELGDA